MSIYKQSDANVDQNEAQERKDEISARGRRARAAYRKHRIRPMLVFVGTGKEIEQMGRIRLTRRYSGNIEE